MDLELDEDQEALAESVRSVLAREWPVSAARRLVEEGDGADVLWERMVQLDWPALCTPESVGGMGYGAVEATLVFDRCGAAMAPGPLFPTIGLFVPLVRELGSEGQRAELLGPVAAGGRTGTAAVTELTKSGTGVDVESSAVTVGATRDRDGWRLSGTLRSVIEPDRVDHVAVPAGCPTGEAGDAGIGVFLVDPSADGVVIERVGSLDATRPLATVHLRDVRIDADAFLAGTDEQTTAAAVRRALDESVTLLAADLVGTCGTIFDLTLEHVKRREQFGVKIGSFQAVKHRLADAYLSLEAARAAVLVAGAAVAEDDPRRTVAASTAKALAGDCAELLCEEGIQLLGGIGFTWEHDMHLYVKRAMSSSALLGGAEAHRQRVADLLGMVGAGS